jgi:predicted transcriptional regulator
MKAKSGITQRVWLFLLEHGGHWTTAELAEQMGSDAGYMDRIIWSMHAGGTVSKYRSGQRKNGTAFGVTQANRIPHGLSLRQVTQAQAVRAEIESKPAANDAKTREAA